MLTNLLQLGCSQVVDPLFASFVNSDDMEEWVLQDDDLPRIYDHEAEIVALMRQCCLYSRACCACITSCGVRCCDVK